MKPAGHVIFYSAGSFTTCPGLTSKGFRIPFSRAMTFHISGSPYSIFAMSHSPVPWRSVRYLVRSGDSKGYFLFVSLGDIRDLNVRLTFARTGIPFSVNMV